jgi:large subunit ribosomal protein L15
MQRHELQPKTPRKRKKLIGRGDKTAGRGTKGQKARAGHKIRPEIRDFIKTLPKLRGRGKNSNKSINVNKPEAVSLTTISTHFKDGDIVSPSNLSKKGLVRKVSGRLPVVKILSTGELKLKVTVINCLVSGTAKEKIESAGGKIK